MIIKRVAGFISATLFVTRLLIDVTTIAILGLLLYNKTSKQGSVSYSDSLKVVL